MSRIAKAAAVTAAAGAVLAAGAGMAAADAGAQGAAVGSPGVVSGNLVEVPVYMPVNLCGNTFGGGLLNPAFGSHCANGSVTHQHGGGDYRGGW